MQAIQNLYFSESTHAKHNISVNIVLSQISGLNNFFTLFETETTPGSENVSYALPGRSYSDWLLEGLK